MGVVDDAARVFAGEDVLDVVFELLPANGAYHMVRARSRLIDAFRMLLLLRLLPLHIRDVVVIFLVEEICVLFGEFALFLKLKN